MKALSKAEKQQLINKGFDASLFDVLTIEQQRELLEQNESLQIRVGKQRSNICTELVESFEGVDVIEMTKAELAERIRLLNQTSFFTIKHNGKPFELSNSEHAKTFFLLKDYAFSNELDNKQVNACTTEKDKVKTAIGLWLARGRAICNSEITKPTHSKYFNGYKLPYEMIVDGQNVTFKRR